MNYIKQFVRDNGLELGTHFEIVGIVGKYMLEKDTFGRIRIIYLKDGGNMQFNTLCALLQGRFTVKKLPFKPKKDEKFYSVNENKAIDKGIWCDDYIDFALYITGNCYRTREEAEANIDKHIKAWKSAGVELP